MPEILHTCNLCTGAKEENLILHDGNHGSALTIRVGRSGEYYATMEFSQFVTGTRKFPTWNFLCMGSER